MKHAAYFIFVLLVMATQHINAQTATGMVTDAETGKPLAYANIGLPSKNIGTTTDEKGMYTLPMPGTTGNDTVRISIIGYKPMIMSQAQLLQHANIALRARENELKEVVVRPRKLRHSQVGYTNDNKHVIIGFGHYRPGYELGAMLHMKHDPTYIDSVRINVAKCEADTLFFRLNIAEENDGNFNSILRQPIYITVATKDALNKLVVDLTPYNLVAHNNILVSVELVKDFGAKEMFLCAKVLGHPAYMRTVSQAPWTKINVGGLAISAYVTY